MKKMLLSQARASPALISYKNIKKIVSHLNKEEKG